MPKQKFSIKQLEKIVSNNEAKLQSAGLVGGTSIKKLVKQAITAVRNSVPQ